MYTAADTDIVGVASLDMATVAIWKGCNIRYLVMNLFIINSHFYKYITYRIKTHLQELQDVIYKIPLFVGKK
jgi:hypothetical protein